MESLHLVADRFWAAASTLLPVLGPVTPTKRMLLYTLLVGYLSWRILKRRLALASDANYIVKKTELDSTAKSFQFVGKRMPSLEEIPAMVAEMRTVCDSGYTRPIATRMKALRAIRTMLVTHEQEFLDALKSDLGRPGFEGLYYDVLLPLSEVDHLIAHTEEWAAPESRGFNLVTFPSSAYIYKEPFGMVLVIGTWNYPIMLSLVPVVGAIAAGNSVVLKPCNVSGACAKLLARLIPQFVDPLVCSVLGTNVEGDRTTTAALLKCKFDHIFFTGSPSVGKVIMRGAAEHLTPCTLELGGKNPVFVNEDADIELAAKRTVGPHDELWTTVHLT